jgi:hypothetical protein
LLGNGLKMIQDQFNSNVWYLGDFHIVPDEEYLKWLEEQLEDLYDGHIHGMPHLESRVEDLEREAAGCRNRLGI